MKFLAGILLFVASLGAQAHPFTDAQALLNYEVLLDLSPDEAAKATLNEDFEFLKANGVMPPNALLRVLKANIIAEAHANEVVAVSAKLAQSPREARLFVLAHEAGHLLNKDEENKRLFIEESVSPLASWQEMRQQYAAVLPLLQQAAKLKEFKADLYAHQELSKLGIDARGAAHKLFTNHASESTVWHPASRDRLAALQKLK